MIRGSDSKSAPKNISVFLRIRPPIARESNSSFKNLVCDPTNPKRVTVTRGNGGAGAVKSFMFNRVFGPNSRQEEVYKEFARGAVDAAFDGQHGVLFVYGQTGSGKTYTISNDDPQNPGVLQQSLRDIWKRLQEDKKYDYSCSVSYVQLYNEILTDLLDPQKGRVRIQLGPEGRGDVVLVTESGGLSIEKKVNSYEESIEYFYEGMERKEMTSTMMNNTSSRSHTVFYFNITRSSKAKTVEAQDYEKGEGPVTALEGRLIVCDLAGCERASRTKAEGKTLGEANHINGSLLVLGKVVAALTESGSQHAPFRESKLTRILQYSLLGNGNTSIVVNCSPADDSTEETLSAIMFGQRAIQIKQDAKRHEILDYKALYMQLLAEMDKRNDGTLESALSEERAVYEDRIRGLEEKLKMLTSENDVLRQENSKLRNGRSGGGAGSSGGDKDSWQDMTSELWDAISKRDSKIRVLSDEQRRLAVLLAEEKRTTFLIAQKLRATMMRFFMQSKLLTERLRELKTELMKAKGTDYIDFQSSSQYDEPTDADIEALIAQQCAGSGDGFLQEQLEKAQQELRSLHEDRSELILYQSMSEKAIRMLHAEKTALAAKVAKLTSQQQQ
ncbi:Microtubule binding Kinesin motor domain [Trypanosoma vivax]|uniref:Putative kinesin n=1 Tax=Trypanosoma vivax (strain Y486) TaxID=1055687 RepID=G0TWJ0_TRYVY|nr:putative kinesin [Trypanosoma vivax]KAH8609216.1 Microtubule binding Kinesin motor domain [Trypanosoma vivax]CCC48328.1 putative kinesin [Trypanosoma vivax Y486]